MDFTKKAKDEIDARLDAVEDFIASRGIGSTYLTRAKKVQRNVNLAIAAGCLITITGIAIWALNGSNEEDES